MRVIILGDIPYGVTKMKYDPKWTVEELKTFLILATSLCSATGVLFIFGSDKQVVSRLPNILKEIEGWEVIF